MVKAGLEDIAAGSSTICNVDGKEGRLIYRGYDIHDLLKISNPGACTVAGGTRSGK